MLQNILIWHQNKYFCTKLHEFKKIAVPLHPLTKKNASTTLHQLVRALLRDVARLVGHYVRDVGGRRSSSLLPDEDSFFGWSFLLKKQEKTCFLLVFCSLIRTFAG